MPNEIELAAQKKADKKKWIENVLSHGDQNNYFSSGDMSRFRDYLGSMYDQYKGSDRWSEIESITNAFNPGQRTGWDGFTESLGFGSSYRDNYVNSMNQMISALGQISSTNREESYNSASQAADRMRAAGLNPDLQGVEGAGQASEFSEPEFTPMQPSGGIGQAFDLASNIAGIFSTAVAMTRSFKEMKGIDIANLVAQNNLDNQPTVIKQDNQIRSNQITQGELGIEGARLTNEGTKITNQGKILSNEGASQDFITKIHELAKQEAFTFSSLPGKDEISPINMKKHLADVAAERGLTAGQTRAFVRYGMDAYYSLPGETQRYRDFADRENARFSAGDAAGKVASYGETSGEGISVIKATAKYSYQMSRLALDSEKKLSKEQNEWNSIALSHVDPNLAGENMQGEQEVQQGDIKNRKIQNEITHRANEITRAYLQTLEENSENGDALASILLLKIAGNNLGVGAPDADFKNMFNSIVSHVFKRK